MMKKTYVGRQIYQDKLFLQEIYFFSYYLNVTYINILQTISVFSFTYKNHCHELLLTLFQDTAYRLCIETG